MIIKSRIFRNFALFFVFLTLFSLVVGAEVNSAACGDGENNKAEKCNQTAAERSNSPFRLSSNLPASESGFVSDSRGSDSKQAENRGGNAVASVNSNSANQASENGQSNSAVMGTAQPDERLKFLNQIFTPHQSSKGASASAADAFFASNLLSAPVKIGAETKTGAFNQSLFDGCSHGYWKNHPNSWVGYSTTQTLENVFEMPDSLGLDNATLMDALNFQGGGGAVGAAKNLMRQAVGVLLNAAHPSIYAPITQAEVINITNTALMAGVSETQSLTVTFDNYNNLGCPIDAHGGGTGTTTPPGGGGNGTTTPPGGGGNGTTTPPGGGGNGTTTPPGGGGTGTTTPPGGNGTTTDTGNTGGGGLGGTGGVNLPGGGLSQTASGGYFGGAGGSIGGGKLPNDTGGLLSPMLPDAGVGPTNTSVSRLFLAWLGIIR